MDNIRGQVVKGLLLPGIIPRIRDLFGSGFGLLSYMVAYVYSMVRILPRSHPYLRLENRGSFTVLNAIAEAANHIRFSRKNIDQIIIFLCVIASLIIMAGQFIILAVKLFISNANAAAMPTSVEEFFQTSNPKEDLAYRLLDMVFGVPDIFNSKELEEQIGTGMHKALQALFEFYSLGMIAVGSIIIIYFVVTIINETAVSGVPFGKRFNKAWAVPRVILFFGLLIPFSHGMNGGQYVTLYAAKLGSMLASKGWTLYHETIQQAGATLTGQKEQNVMVPKPSDLNHIPAFMMVAKTCQVAYNSYPPGTEGYKRPPSWNDGVKAWAVYKTPPQGGTARGAQGACSDESIDGWTAEELGSRSFQDLSSCSKGNTIHLVFGVQDKDLYGKFRASVKPVCGSIASQVVDLSQPGAAEIQEAYLTLIKDMWAGGNDLQKYAEGFVKRNHSGDPDPSAELPDKSYIERWSKILAEKGDEAIKRAVQRQIDEGDWQMPDKIKQYGWAGAGVWFNEIASQNGALVSAVRIRPMAVLFPLVMEYNKMIQNIQNVSPQREEIFSSAQEGESVQNRYEFAEEKEIANTLNHAYQFWEGSKNKDERQITNNPFIDTINFIFGTYGLFDICENTNVHPLAQLAGLGKSMIDSAIMSLAASGLTGIVAIFPSQFSPTFEAASSFFGTVATIGLMIGFILFYILPFFPFLYFFFAVGSWVKTIFEAMVAVPLWAIGHLRIDGESIPGEAALEGYYLIFEIFIRPILIIFGLIASIIIFASLARVLNDIYYLVVSNLSGQDPKSSTTSCLQAPSARGTAPSSPGADADLKDAYRGPIDEFFFTIVYTVMIYIMAQASFKLIDQIPGQILRWLGAQLPTFSDDAGDAAQGLLLYASIGGGKIGGELGEGLSGLTNGIKGSVHQALKG